MRGIIVIFLFLHRRLSPSCASLVEELAEQYRNLPRVDFSLADAQDGDVTYIYFQDVDDAGGKVVTKESVKKEQILKKSLPLILLIHGWTTDDTSPWYKPLKDAFFSLGPHNVVYVNWSKAGNKTYSVSSANIKPVGKMIAQFLIATEIPPEDIHLIGHSLGSHLASSVGKHLFELTGKKIGRITAPDPAGPMFASPEMTPNERLSPNDALFVDVIHTDIQLYGFTAPLGHVDYYPNDGKYQPGCPPRTEFENCHHARSTIYFIESMTIRSKAFEATFLEINYNVTIQVKPKAKEIIFGQHVDKSSRGVYYFRTNPERPHLL